MKKILVAGTFAVFSVAAQAEYQAVNLTVFGMDCAPCAHAIHVSMKGIQGVQTVDVNLNTGLVTIKLAPGNKAGMRQFNEAVEKNGFTRTYFLKAVGMGDTVGGVVECRWLDFDGYSPKDTAAEARIQSAIKASPYLISVSN